MINKFEFTNSTNEMLTLDLTNPYVTGIAVSKVTGLDPVVATINATEVSTLDGGFFNSARLSTRNIVFSLIYLWEGPGSIEDKRHMVYKFFSVKKHIQIKIFTDSRTLITEGYVEKNEVEIFSKEEGSEISIICPDPYFYSANGDQVTDLASSEPLFTFTEVANAIIGRGFHSTEAGSIVMGRLLASGDMVVRNEGDADCGCILKLYIQGPVSGTLSITNIGREETFKVDLDAVATRTGDPVGLGDQIEITTIKGKKAIILLRGNQAISLLPCLDRKSVWPQLSPGKNEIAITATGSENIQLSVENPIMYEGV